MGASLAATHEYLATLEIERDLRMEAFLSCCVPNLKLDSLVIQLAFLSQAITVV